MKIKLTSNGQVINPPLRVAQRYIRLGRASVYEEPKSEPVKAKTKKPKHKKAKKVEDNISKGQLDSTEDRADTKEGKFYKSD